MAVFRVYTYRSRCHLSSIVCKIYDRFSVLRHNDYFKKKIVESKNVDRDLFRKIVFMITLEIIEFWQSSGIFLLYLSFPQDNVVIKWCIHFNIP